MMNRKTNRFAMLCIVLLLSLSGSLKASFNTSYNFFHFNRNDGLSHNQVHSIIQDSRGYIWVGTLSGLNRHNGNGFTVFKQNSENEKSLTDNNIFNLFEDHSGKIWVQIAGAWDIFDPEKEEFSPISEVVLNGLSIPMSQVNRIFTDQQKRDWFTTSSMGAICHDPRTNTITQLKFNRNDQQTVSSEFYAGVSEDSQGNIWLISNYGVLEKIDGQTFEVLKQVAICPQKSNSNLFNLFIDNEDMVWVYAINNALGAYSYDPKREAIQHFSTSAAKFRVSSNIISGIEQDDDGIIWFSTDHGGLTLFDKKSGNFNYLKPDPFSQSSISANNLVTMFKDSYGTIWLGTFKDGIDCYHKDAFLFNLIKDNPLDTKDINEDDVNCITEDASGYLWFGTNGSGLVRFDRQQNEFKHFRHSPKNNTSISNDVIVTLSADHRDQLWIGTYFGGLNRYDGKQFYHYKNEPANHESLSDNRVFSIFEDSKKNLWIGTLGGGLNLYNREKNVFSHFREGDINSIHSNFIFDIKEDKKGNIWIATAIGLSRFVVETGRFIHYASDANNPRSISNNNLLNLFIDSNENLWVGTREGLNRYNYDTDDFEVIKTEQGLPDNYICSITGDYDGNIWVATPYNLSRLVWTKNSPLGEIFITHYSESDGLQGGEFNVNSSYLTRDGEIYIGGTKGVNYFNPKLIKDLPSNSKLAITGFSLFNKLVRVGEKINSRVLLPQSLFDTKEITLKHNETMFSIEFSDLFFLRNDFEHFYYKLEGFNTSWIKDENKSRVAHFTNLNPGEYTFVVRKSRSINSPDYVEQQLSIIIKPPFWKTPWAYIAYFLLIIGALLMAREVVLARERIKAKSVLENQQVTMQREMDLMKLRFFTNISHELKTPLSLILSPIEDLLKNEKEAPRYNQLKLIHRNALRLYNMVTQLLDFRKMDAQKMELSLAEGDFVSFVRHAVESFSDMANKKEIDLIFAPQVAQLFVSFDKRKCERIVFNLLSNAFKFTQGNGRVEVSINTFDRDKLPFSHLQLSSSSQQFIEICVKDTGVGIEPENQERVFERFFQESGGNDYNEGSGIGLSIIKEYTHLMGGDVALESEKGKGSAFFVYFPLNTAAVAEILVQTETDEEIEQKVQKEMPTLLIVEDNDDFRAYIRQGFENQYHIVEAANGEEGIKLAFANLPDLVISDIMMPVMDGIEMCRKLKSDIRTSHIPVILLTAVNNQQKMLDGFETGADDYITKPFNPDILASRIKNLIDQREKLHRNFKMQMKMEPQEVAVTSLDEKIINKAIVVVEKNIGNPDFSVTELSSELGMSRVNLYKKLKSLTGHTPIEFIRAFRIKRAAQLLAKSQMGVSEVAYLVGFNDPRYFTRYFKAEFKMLPSDYARKHKDSGSDQFRDKLPHNDTEEED